VDVEKRIEQVETLQRILVNRVSYISVPDKAHEHYAELRRSLIQSARVKPVLPEFVVDCRSLDHAHSRVNEEVGFDNEKELRRYIWKSLRKPLDLLERELIAPADFEVTGTLERLDSPQIHGAWKKALDRRAIQKAP
jgi:hypothetical protein